MSVIYICSTSDDDSSFDFISLRIIVFFCFARLRLVYSFIFISGLCRIDMEVFLALGTRICLFRFLFGGGPSARTAQSLLSTSFVCPHVCVCDVCVYEYASTKVVCQLPLAQRNC